MGFRITLVSMPAQSSTAMLQRLGLTRTDEPDEANESPFNGAINGENYLLWVNDDAHVVMDEELSILSAGTELLVLRANETVMISEIAKFENGEKVWSLIHDCNEGMEHLARIGDPPTAWQQIRDDVLAQAAPDEDGETDFVYDVPVALFKHLTGFRYDEVSELSFFALHGESASGKKSKPFWKLWS